MLQLKSCLKLNLLQGFNLSLRFNVSYGLIILFNVMSMSINYIIGESGSAQKEEDFVYIYVYKIAIE